MKKRYYLLIASAIIIIAFFQPFVLVIGNLVIIFGTVALVYAGLTPDQQDAFEQKLGDIFKQTRSYLRRPPQVEQKMRAEARKSNSWKRLLGRKTSGPEDYEIDVTDQVVDAEIISDRSRNEKRKAS